MESIAFGKMLEIMDSGSTFHIGFRTRDEKKDTGGEWIEIEEACKTGFTNSADRKQQERILEPKAKRNPNHFENSTRNIKVLANGSIIKVHLRLIRRFNNKIVQ